LFVIVWRLVQHTPKVLPLPTTYPGTHQLVENARQQFSKGFLFTISTDGKSVCRQRGLDFWVSEVKHVAIIFDHVHLFNALYAVNGQLLEGVLKFLVISGSFMDNLLLSSCCTLV